MEAVILAGGRGTRLRPYTTVFPKPLMPVHDKPILEIILRQLKNNGINKVTITVNHLAEIIMAFFGNGEKLGLEIVYSLETKPLGTVGPVKLIKDLPDYFFVMNGDLLNDINFHELYHWHIASNAKLTVATYQRDTMIDFGVMEVDTSINKVIGFKEKPTYHFEVSTGVYVYSKSLLDRIPDDQYYGFDNLVLDMLRDNDPINTYLHNGYWLDIGRPEDYDLANQQVWSI